MPFPQNGQNIRTNHYTFSIVHGMGYTSATGCDVKHLMECKPFVGLYFDYMVEKDLSAWTIRTRMFSLAAAFMCDVTDFGVELPARSRGNIIRTRSTTKTSERFESEQYDVIKKFAIATGARREGMQKLTKTDLMIKPGGDLLIHLDEKGGKERDALVLPEYAEFVKQVFKDSPGYGPNKKYLFPKGFVPQSMTVHCYRAAYAQLMYKVLESRELGDGTEYRCRLDMRGEVFDRNLLLRVSRYTGHNRLDVIVGNYFYKFKELGGKLNVEPCR